MKKTLMYAALSLFFNQGAFASFSSLWEKATTRGAEIFTNSKDYVGTKVKNVAETAKKKWNESQDIINRARVVKCKKIRDVKKGDNGEKSSEPIEVIFVSLNPKTEKISAYSTTRMTEICSASQGKQIKARSQRDRNGNKIAGSKDFVVFPYPHVPVVETIVKQKKDSSETKEIKRLTLSETIVNKIKTSFAGKKYKEDELKKLYSQVVTFDARDPGVHNTQKLCIGGKCYATHDKYEEARNEFITSCKPEASEGEKTTDLELALVPVPEEMKEKVPGE